MSISKLRGCFSRLAPILVTLMGLILLVGFLWQGNGRGRGGTAESEASRGQAMFIVDGQEVYEGTLREYVNAQLSQALQNKPKDQLPEITPTEQLGFYTLAATSGVGEAVLRALLDKEGISVNENDIVDFVVKGQEDNIAQQQSQFGIFQKIRIQMAEKAYDDAKKKDPNSTDAKDKLKALDDTRKSTFEEDFKKNNQGMTPQQLIDTVRQRVPEMLKEPATYRSYELQAMISMLRDKVAGKANTSDEALKKTYDRFGYEQISIIDGGQAKAEEVLKKIKGGMSFKEAATQFTSMKDATGKPLTNEVSQVRYELQSLDGFKKLLDMKPGDISDVVMIGTTAYILKLNSVKPDVPKDFDTAKKERAKQISDAYAQDILKKMLEDAKKAALPKIQWKDEGWKLVYDWSELQAGDKSKTLAGPANKDKRVAAYKDIVARSKNTVSVLSDLAPLVRYSALQQLDVEIASGPEKAEITKQLDDSLQEVAVIVPSNQLRRQLINSYLVQGNGDKALEQLLEIVRSAYPPGPATAPLITEATELLPKVSNFATKGNKLIADIQKELTEWRKEEKEQKEADEKVRLEEARQKAENARQDAELKKKEQQKPKADINPPTTNPKPPKPGG